MIPVSDTTFEQEVIQYNGIVLVYFHSTICAPCTVMKPIIELIEAHFPSVKFCSAELVSITSITDRYHIKRLPTIMIFKNGSIVRHFVGLISKGQLRKKLQELQ